MLHYRQGDPTFTEEEGPKIIAHVCGDSGLWQGGFASAISQRWPEAESAYREWASTGSWQDEGFGLGGLQLVPVEVDVRVANMIARRDQEPAGEAPSLRYGALETCLHKLLRAALADQASIHLPRLGAGSTGADPTRIDAMLRKMLHPVEAVVYE